ncbi:hypothetical protein ACFO0N_05525 [Halobium salinum]|uniref:Right handed beta helix region n=1 Tax=Halobium salinum TaxID=1364940 RepID=A0ABD5PAD9_9EURY|nr:hypothetical protein [Halobium salinum]
MSGTNDTRDGESGDEQTNYGRRRFLQLSGFAAGTAALAGAGSESAAAAGRTWDVRDVMAANGWDADRALDEVVGWADPGDTVRFRDGEYEISRSHHIGKSLTITGTDGARLVRTTEHIGIRFVGDGLTGDWAETTGDVPRGSTSVPVDASALNVAPGDYVQIRAGDYHDAGSDGGTNEFAVELAEVTGVGSGAIEVAEGTRFAYDSWNGQVERVDLLAGPRIEGLTMVGDNNDPDIDYMSRREYTRDMFEMQWVRDGVFADSTVENYFSAGFYFFDCKNVTWDNVTARHAQSKGPGKGEPLKAEHCTGVTALSTTTVDCRRGVDVGQGTTDVLVKNPTVRDCSLVGVGQHPNTDEFRAGTVRIEGGDIETVSTGISHADGDTTVVGTRVTTGATGLAIEGANFEARDVTIVGKAEGGSGPAVKVKDDASNVSVQGTVRDEGNTFRNAAVVIHPEEDISNLDFDLDITSDNRFYAFDMNGVTVADVAVDGALRSSPDNTDIAVHATYRDSGVIDGLDFGADIWNHGGSGICLLRGDAVRRVRVHDATLEVGGDYGVWIGYDLQSQQQTLVENCVVRGAETRSLAFDGDGSVYVTGNQLDDGMRAARGIDVYRESYDYGGGDDGSSGSGSGDGSDADDGSGSSGSGGDKTLAVVGTGDPTEYEFVVTADLVRGDNTESGDLVDGVDATGTVQWRSDNYHFSGDLEAFTVRSGDEDVDIWVEGAKYAPSDFPEVGSSGSSGSGSGDAGTYDREMAIVGTGDDVSYDFTVSGDLRATDNVESGDSVSGSSASGSVQWRSDNYQFSGEFTEFTADGPVAVWINGERYDPVDLGQEWHTLTVVGEDGVVDYKFSVSGGVKPTGTLEDSDTVLDGGGAGVVGNGYSDGYTFTGDLTDFTVTEGDVATVSVLVDGEAVTVGDAGSGGSGGSGGSTDDGSYDRELSVVGTGEDATYRFTVADGVGPTDNTESGDGVSDTTASGSVQWRSDNYRFAGDITSFEVDGPVDLWVDGEKRDPAEFGADDSGSGGDAGTYDREMSILGTGDDADYDFTVSGDLRATDNTESDDSVSGSSGSGSVRWYSDNYQFSGTVTDFSVDGRVEVWIDGEKYDPAYLG